MQSNIDRKIITGKKKKKKRKRERERRNDKPFEPEAILNYFHPAEPKPQAE